MNIKSIIFDKPGSVVLGDAELQTCGENEIIAETIYSFVSPGTELRILTGKQPNTKFPLIPGYAWVGRVIEVGKQVKGWQTGELVSGRNPLPVPGVNVCWGGQSSHHRCDPSNMIVKLPQDADPWDYVHAEVAAISYRGATAACPLPNETAVVIGQGMIGMFSTQWLLLHGVRVIVVDIEDFRLEPARKWGVAAALNAKEPDIREKILSYCPGGADIVVESSASLDGVELAASLLRKPSPQALGTVYRAGTMHSNGLWPRLVFQASYHNLTLETRPQGVLPSLEGVLVLQPCDRTVDDRLSVIEHIRRGHLPVSEIIDKAVPVSDAPSQYLNLLNNPGRIRGLAFQWE
ncbi:MAG: zinc-binding dehydrogenase [Planctomycetota bacterium]